MDYWIHFQILLFCFIIGTGISLFLGVRSYIKIALVVIVIFIPIEIYYSYKLSQLLIPIMATLPHDIIPQSIKNINQLSSSHTITADGSLIKLPVQDSSQKSVNNTVISNLESSNIIQENNNFSTHKTLEDIKYSDKQPFDGLDPTELMSRLNYIYYASSQPAKKINYHEFKTHADQLLDTNLHLTSHQINTHNYLNNNSCVQVAQDFNILDKGINVDNVNLVVREDFSMPKNLEAIVSLPLPLETADRNSSAHVLFENVPEDHEEHNELDKLCNNCKLAVCQNDYCGLQNGLFM